MVQAVHRKYEIAGAAISPLDEPGPASMYDDPLPSRMTKGHDPRHLGGIGRANVNIRVPAIPGLPYANATVSRGGARKDRAWA